MSRSIKRKQWATVISPWIDINQSSWPTKVWGSPVNPLRLMTPTYFFESFSKTRASGVRLRVSEQSKLLKNDGIVGTSSDIRRWEAGDRSEERRVGKESR